MADKTKNLNVVTLENSQPYLEKQLLLYLDGVQVDQLNIAADLKGRSVTDIQISGSGSGVTQQLKPQKASCISLDGGNKHRAPP